MAEETVEEQKQSKFKDLAEVLLHSGEDNEDILSNLPIRQVNPLSRIRMHMAMTKVLVEAEENYQKWLDKRAKKYGGRKFRPLTDYERALSEEELQEAREAAYYWLRAYRRNRRALDGNLESSIVLLAQDQMSQERPIEETPYEQFMKE